MTSPPFPLRPSHLHTYQPAWPVTHLLYSLSHYNRVSLLPSQATSLTPSSPPAPHFSIFFHHIGNKI